MNAELFCQARTILSLTPMIVAFKSQHENEVRHRDGENLFVRFFYCSAPIILSDGSGRIIGAV